MNGINSIRNGYNHFKAMSTQNNDISFNLKTEMTTVLPSIANLNNVGTDNSFNSYLNSSSIQTTNSVGSTQNIMITSDYQNTGSLQYSLPAIRGFSQLNNQQYYSNNNGFSQPSCNSNNIHYQYQDYSYNPIVTDRNWIDPYPNECQKPSLPPFQIPQSSYLSNNISHLNVSDDIKISSKNNMKDEKYSIRRQKNNIAAKKCRDNKKLKNQEVCDLIMKYEKDNEELKIQINSIKSQIEELVKQLR